MQYQNKKNMKLLENVIASYKHIPYTVRHYFAYLKTEKELLGNYKYKFHDFDKLFMYVFLPYLGVDKISEIHKKINKHHIQNNKDFSDCDYIAAIIDWESASYTKPDKPMNARVFTEFKFKNSKHYNILINNLKSLKL